nr:hypothetical protein [Escherichia coli]
MVSFMNRPDSGCNHRVRQQTTELQEAHFARTSLAFADSSGGFSAVTS